MLSEIPRNLLLPYPHRYKQAWVNINTDQQEKRRLNAFTIYNCKQSRYVGKPSVQKRSLQCSTEFRKLYLSRELPIVLEHGRKSQKVIWILPIENLNVGIYLPILVEGVADTEFPYYHFAYTALLDLLEHAQWSSIFDAIPRVIVPLKKCTRTMNATNIKLAMEVISKMIQVCPQTASYLAIFITDIFKPTSRFFMRSKENGTCIESPTGRVVTTAKVWDTIRLIEKYAGIRAHEAYVNAKLAIPTYESGAEVEPRLPRCYGRIFAA